MIWCVDVSPRSGEKEASTDSCWRQVVLEALTCFVFGTIRTKFLGAGHFCIAGRCGFIPLVVSEVFGTP